MNRRHFCSRVALGSLGLMAAGRFSAVATNAAGPRGPARGLFEDLLRDWGEGLLRHQINTPGDLSRHGALGCPACSFIHGRCMDALYPFLHLARVTADPRYLAAARAVYDWAERNVSHEDGSWTVIADPKSWKGITIFGAIALAEALHHHGELLDQPTREIWMRRLAAAADYVHRTFTIDFTNINYPAIATYGLHLFGEVLEEPVYQAHAHKLAAGVREFFTEPNSLLFGEGKPSNARSQRGLPAVDLGYNVEHSLPALSLYARDTGDTVLEDLLVRSWRSHLAFMLPDGAWDNSWGTRQAKWSYWGSRTCDGCQPGLAVLADRDPTFGTAAIRNAELMRACTQDGLLHGGPHYVAAGAPPCVHHTFTHAKALAAVLDRGGLVDSLGDAAVLPRAASEGVREFSEVGVWLASRGPWRATTSVYDFLYRADVFAARGGALGMLWHEAVGPLFAASMPRYVKVELNNMQDHPEDRDDALTPRVELHRDEKVWSQLFDLAAEVAAADDGEMIRLDARARLCDEAGAALPGGNAGVEVNHEITGREFVWRARWCGGREVGGAAVLPLICRVDEGAVLRDAHTLELSRHGGTVVAIANVPWRLDEGAGHRIFNLTPGFQAVASRLDFADSSEGEVECRISVRTRDA